MAPKTIIVLLIAILTAVGLTSFSMAEMERMSTDDFQSPTRPAAVFSHDDHNSEAELEDDCALCHHVYEGKELVKDESSEDSACSECHSLTPTEENTISLRTAFHKRCQSCHFERAKGPVLCGECHIRKERIK
jgi:hypothetical protein